MLNVSHKAIIVYPRKLKIIGKNMKRDGKSSYIDRFVVSVVNNKANVFEWSGGVVLTELVHLIVHDPARNVRRNS